MARVGEGKLAAGRAGALAALFGWLAVYLQLTLANKIGFSPLFALWFGVAGGLAAALLGGLFGLGMGLALRRPTVAAVLAGILPFALTTLAVARAWTDAKAAGRGDLLLAPTVQALAIAFVGAATCIGMLLATRRGARSGLAGALVCFVLGGFLGLDPSADTEPADPDRLAVDLQPAGNTPRTLVLCFEGLDATTLDALLAAERNRDEGSRRLPQFASLLEAGTRGDLSAEQPAIAPHTWTTVATGRPWYEHGVREWREWVASGAARPLTLEYLLARPVLEAAAAIVPFLVEERAVTRSAFRQRRAFWEVLGQAGIETAVIGWPLTHPAPAATGTLVFSEATFAPTLSDLSGALSDPQWTPVVTELRSEGTLAELRAEAEALLNELGVQEPQPRAALTDALISFQQRLVLLEETIDAGAANTYVLYDRLFSATYEAFPGGSDIERRSKLATGFLSAADRVLQRLLTRLRYSSGEAQVWVISAGSRPVPRQPRIPGVWLAAGANLARRASLETPTIYDVAPSLLYAKGLPLADDLTGHPQMALFVRDFREQHPPRRLATYEYPGWQLDLPHDSDDDSLDSVLLNELGGTDNGHGNEAPDS